MKTAPRIEEELGEALHAYADRIPAVPDTARLIAALDAAPLATALGGPRAHPRMAGTAAGIALLLGAGGLAWAMTGSDGAEDPVVKVTEVEPVTTAVPSTALPTTAVTTPATTTLAPTTVPPTTAPAAVQAAPPAVTPEPAAPQQQQPAATAAPKQRAAATTAAPKANPPAPPAQPPTVVGFSASAAFGTCGDDPPYDVYSGTANPGSTVTISSAFGGGTARADEHGHWEETIVFQGTPLNETFSVTVSSAQGSDTFSFTHTG